MTIFSTGWAPKGESAAVGGFSHGYLIIYWSEINIVSLQLENQLGEQLVEKPRKAAWRQ